ncbi:hypothetical protein V8G54_005889 [Vigna mungo]|uniref:Ubiquitinyl hydrolase 1 n=1 Tax=Vigna mungo TaxID=3915 RepID=A0AAQ3P0W8_VIGMU
MMNPTSSASRFCGSSCARRWRRSAASRRMPPPEDSPESKTQRRELMAAAVRVLPSSLLPGKKSGELGRREELCLKSVNLSKELSVEEANQLFSMVFGNEVSKGFLAQWSNQEYGGPCGVLAAIQEFVLKHIIFFSNELKDVQRLP